MGGPLEQGCWAKLPPEVFSKLNHSVERRKSPEVFSQKVLTADGLGASNLSASVGN